ncbi:MAG: hypothetical protein GY851_02175 [bacterium]|nr:hypothetical protein [bacterium]
MPDPEPVDWSDGIAPTGFVRGGRAHLDTKFFTPSKGDIKPHFNESLGCHVESRADMLEKGKRRGLRPITPDEIGTPADAELSAKKCRERAHEAVMNPKKSLKDYYIEKNGALPPVEMSSP